MAFLQQGGSAIEVIPAGQSIIIGAFRGAVATFLAPAGAKGGPSSTVSGTSATYGSYVTATTVTIGATLGEIEYVIGVTPALTDAPFTPSATVMTGALSIDIAGTRTTLTNPALQAVNSVNNFTQEAIQNKSAGTSASADFIAYPDNNTNDLTGFADMGMTSSGFTDAAYTVTGQNEAYIFGSAPSGASKSGSLVIATDSTGTNNNIDFFVGGFNKAKTAFSARVLGSNGMFQVNEGLSYLAKSVVANGATTTITIAAKKSYVYITSTAVSLAFTLPAGAAAIDGLVLTMVVDTTIATLTWASAGTTFVGAPAASTANIPIRMIYDHASLKWYPL